MTMKSTLIVPITLLATLAASVLVHDRLRTKPSCLDGAPWSRAAFEAVVNVSSAVMSTAC
jgi:hypothetical protein